LSRVLLTNAKIEAQIERLDQAIAEAEPNAPQFDREQWRELMAMKQERHKLYLLLLARRVERGKKVASLERWRHGFSPEKPEPVG
jgi:hypothetical protein